LRITSATDALTAGSITFIISLHSGFMNKSLAGRYLK
jgi:hypothetical protein